MDCQVVHICDCTPAGIRHALAELPETLDETYRRTLQGINNANWELAHRMFQFVSVASRPLHVKELADLLAFDFEAGSIPKFNKDWRQENPADAVLSTCSTLLTIANDQGFPVIQFSHLSVQEFLTSSRLAEATDINSRRYHVSMTPAHTLVAQASLGILLHLDKDITHWHDSLEDFPLAEYAAVHWIDHARFKDVSQNVEDGMKQLFDPRKPHLEICLWIYEPETRRWGQNNIRNKLPPPLLRTPLHYAASWGLYPVVEFLIVERSQDVCSQDSPDNATPLHLASRNGHMKVARKLIECGADVTAPNNGGMTPLHLALTKRQGDLARMLIEHGADVSAQIGYGETLLHHASYWGQVDLVRILIELGADTTTQNRHGETPLHFMSQRGQVDLARILIEHGADVTAQNNYGWAPLHLALEGGQVDIARMLIERGANVTAQNNDGKTPLHLASQMGQIDVAHMLIERGAEVTAQNNDGNTPLHLASYRGQVDVARMLIERGADLTVQNNDGETPLHLASTPSLWARISPQNYAEIARMLLEHGADPNARNKNGLTPFVLALQGRLTEIIQVFVQHGADSGTHDTIVC